VRWKLSGLTWKQSKKDDSGNVAKKSSEINGWINYLIMLIKKKFKTRLDRGNEPNTTGNLYDASVQ
jgi:hypothetical protein